MEFLGIGPQELVLIVVLALIVFSPRDLAKGGRSVGRFLNRLYRSESYKAMRQVSQEIQTLPSRLAREAQLDELTELGIKIKKDIGSPYGDPLPVHPMPPAEKDCGGEAGLTQQADPEKGTPPDY